MAEINQPTPVKPVWPTRQEQRPLQRRQSEEEEQKKRNHPQQKKDGEKPGIDEYV